MAKRRVKPVRRPSRVPRHHGRITTGPIAGSRKIHVPGSRADLRVPMREVALAGGHTHVLYDTSGPYTDVDARIDVREGLAPLRRPWILERDDVVPMSSRGASKLRPSDEGPMFIDRSSNRDPSVRG
ncbi:MAG: hypothetical protein HY608_03370, partial [Planctomycetes bacterium]|nr:hypothetical protein [Planctomycetota bacterium]